MKITATKIRFAMSHTSIPAGAALVGRQRPAFVVTAVCFWCAIRAYDGHSAPVGFQQVLVCLFGGVIIPLALC